MQTADIAARRIKGLRRFAITTSIVTCLGHLVLGFEQPYIAPIASLLTAYTSAILLEWLSSRYHSYRPAYSGSFQKMVDFLLAPHIIGLTCAMFVFPGDRVFPIMFATLLAICSRTLFRIQTAEGSRHFFNPSNFGILWTLAIFDSVSIFLPYQFHSNLSGPFDIILPVTLLCLGGFLNAKVTKRIPLIAAWLVSFVVQAGVRHVFFDANFFSVMGVATGTAAMLFTFFMITDPGTTPEGAKEQMVFGGSIGILYGALMAMHVLYGLFLALFLVCASRGFLMWWTARKQGHDLSSMGTSHDTMAAIRAS